MNVENVNKVKKIGSGAFSRIYLATSEIKECPRLAIKQFQNARQADQDHFMNESYALEKLSGSKATPNFYKSIPSDKCNYIFMEPLEFYVEFREFLCTIAPTCSMEQKLIITCGLVRVLCEIHKHGIVHGDVKPENIMICSKTLSIKFIDFGFCQWKDWRHTKVGTREYMSPESLQELSDGSCDLNVAKMTDVWALGLVLFELFSADGSDVDYYDRIQVYGLQKQSNYLCRLSILQDINHALLIGPLFSDEFQELASFKYILKLLSGMLEKHATKRHIDLEIIQLFEQQLHQATHSCS